MNKKIMLYHNKDDWSPKDVVYPVLLQRKYDGVAFVNTEKGIESRSGVPFRNDKVNEFLVQFTWPGAVGEFVYQDGGAKSFGLANSLPTEFNWKDVTLVVYDDYYPQFLRFQVPNYKARLQKVRKFVHLVRGMGFDVNILWPETYTAKPINNEDELYMCLRMFDEDKAVEHWEGLMVKSEHARYVHGRTTLKDGWAFKYVPKRYMTGVVKDIIPAENHPERAGAIILSVENEEGKFTVSVGTGFTHKEGKSMIGRKQLYIGRVARFSYLPKRTIDPTRPVHPVFEAWLA